MQNLEPLVSAKVILDSVNVKNGNRLTTMEVTCHRFILAEINTHRMFSRNSASSRAISIEKMIDRVVTNPAIPLEFGMNRPGMQASENFDPLSEEYREIKNIWLKARDLMVDYVVKLNDIGLHKQVANRLLEPFTWHTIIISATEWDNFFSQRCSPLAQPEMRELAYKMRDAYKQSVPEPMKVGQWHRPYFSDEDEIKVMELFNEFVKEKRDYHGENFKLSNYSHLPLEWSKNISAARCARVSYLTHDGKRDIVKDLELFGKLVKGNHWSPFEHVAVADDWNDYYGNFKGWKQLRKFFENENVTNYDYNQ